MSPRLLLDTHIVIRWLTEPKRLSREQMRALRESVRRNEPLAISAMTLLEIALILTGGVSKIKVSMESLFEDLKDESVFQILPLTIEIATEAAYLGSLRDPADRVIVATARVHRLRLLTSDQRILESDLAPDAIA